MVSKNTFLVLLGVAILMATSLAIAQSDRGTITGTIIDPAGLVVPGAIIKLTNQQNGSVSETVSTQTGNFTVPSLPVGIYNLSVTAAGFKQSMQENVHVGVDEVLRIDINLQLGQTTESVTVSAAAPLLRTENAEQSINLTGDRVNSLPLNFGGGNSGAGAIRSPYAFATLLPGTSGISQGSSDEVSYGTRIGGLPGDTYKVLVEGQDGTSGNDAGWTIYVTQPSVEMIEEFSLQTSNFAPEFGQVGGGLFNFTTRSGGNKFHGSAYEYLANEALDARQPFTHQRYKNRKSDYGFSVGGPVWIPKLYDGHSKTFFFYTYEGYRINTNTAGQLNTVPTAKMRTGDFSEILTNRKLGTDGLGRAIMENAIYDPSTSKTVNGTVYRDPYPNNVIPQSVLDPVALKIQSLFPAPQNANLVNNWEQNVPDRRSQYISSFKIDHNFGPTSKLSFYYSKTQIGSDQESTIDGLPVPLTGGAWVDDWSHTGRLNYDLSLSPRLLIHLGVGAMRYREDSANAAVSAYDALSQVGFVGSALIPAAFPNITGMSSSFGGMMNIGSPNGVESYYDNKYTGVASASYVHNNHTYKLGAEYSLIGYTDRDSKGSNGILSVSTAETGLPSTQGQSLGGGSIGFGYASFLLGRIDSASVTNPLDPQYRRPSWALYLQDTWKIKRTLTLDYGLRWDYQQYGHEIYYRSSQFAPDVRNPSAGNLLGAMEYEGYGPGRCNCTFTKSYPYAIGPRLGAAYQVNSKTVLRGGWGFVYSRVRDYDYGTRNMIGVGGNTLNWTSTAYGDPAAILKTGLQYSLSDLRLQSLDPGLRPQAGQLNWPGIYNDPNMGRPGRINQWNISLQREITKNLVIEAAYVGNRGVWLIPDTWSGSGALGALNVMDGPYLLKNYGLDINNATDRTLLTSRINSATAANRGFKIPYAGYPVGSTVAQVLRPYPQFNNAITPRGAPLGKSWYDSLQVKVNKRYSHGLNLTSAFTWQKELQMGTGGGSTNNIFTPQLAKSFIGNSEPFALVIGYTYETPRFSKNRLIASLTGHWAFGGILKYTSGMPIASPASQNSLSSLIFQSTKMNRVPGQPLYLYDLNCRSCFDPNKDFVLNPKAWTDAPAGQWGTAAIYYGDYRTRHLTGEQMSVGRNFRVREGMNFSFRAEFFNVFNRVNLPSPSSSNPLSTQTGNAAGVPTSGFGYINAINTGGARNGQIVARFEF
jgi:hypothetical protein